MMKCFYFLLLVAAAQGYVARVARDAKDLPAPTLIRITAFDGPSFSVEWTPVKSPDSSEPVLGYKVKVWEEKKVQQFHYQNVNGEKVLVEENVPVKFPNNNQIPEGKPKEILVDGAEKTSAKMDHIEVGVTYETRVQAYTKSGDGPLSQPMRIKIMPDNKEHQKDVYTVA